MRIAISTLLSLVLTGTAAMQAQTADATHPVADRLTAPIVESSRVTLQGTVHPLANKANDRGAVSDGTKLERLQIVLKRSDAQEASLKRLIDDLHAPGSASYHKWLTPEQFGAQFGPSDGDLATLEGWLQSKGFSVTKVAPGRQVLEIAGTAGQLRNTFHTEMHQYAAQGGIRYANATAPDIPSALAPVFGGFVSLNNFRFKSHVKSLGKAQFNPTTHESKPEWTYGTSSDFNLVLAPADFAVQYDLKPAYTAGTTGTGQTVAIINDSNINIELVNNYRSLFNLSANPPQVIIDGSDPGVDGINSPIGPNYDSVEAYLDVELSGAVAPSAQIDLVIANDTAVDSGLTLAMERAVYSDIAPVLSLSFGGCEAAQGSFNGFISSLWEQAAAQGQTVLVSSGDSGSAGCDDGTEFAVGGQAVNGLASTPYNVAVGGTDFYYANYASSPNYSTYWNLTPSNFTPTVSLLSRVPEQPWNDSQYGLDTFNYYAETGGTTIAAGSGGPSNCAFGTGTTSDGGWATCTGPYPKPSWQTSATPADGARDLPDLSLFASNGANNSYYPICANDGDCIPVSSGYVQISGVGGTSASTPSFAAIMALINQKYGPQGQADYILYPLAAHYANTFNDVTAGTNTVPCNTTTVYTTNSNGVTTGSYPPNDCIAVSNPITLGASNADSEFGDTTEGEIGFGTTAAYNAGTGYDLATGLGTVDASNLITNWGKVTLASTATTLTPSATTFAHGTAVTISGAVTGTTTPTGDVSLVTTSTIPLNGSGVSGTYFTLNNGTYTGSVNYLPGGSYNIYGYYPGNGVDGPSQSTPVAITVTPESSTTALKAYDLLNSVTVASGSTVSYGSPNALAATALTTSGATPTTAPTGSMTFLDGSTTLATTALNSNGNAGYNGAFAIGSHSITATYSGDSSYSASTSAATTFTVTKNTPNILVTYTNLQDTSGNPLNGQVTYLAVQVENSASVSGFAAPPTGTITLSGAPSGSTTSATLVAGVDPNTQAPQGTGYFAIPATASGNYSLTINYPGDSNYSSANTGGTIKFDAGGGTATTTTTATATSIATSPTSAVTVTAIVTSTGSTAPQGTVYLVASGYVLASGTLPSGSGNNVSLTFNLNSGSLFQGTNQITVQYVPSGSSWGPSATIVTVTNPLSDFSIVPTSSILSVPGTGASAGIETDAITLSSTNGFAGAVSLSCSTPAAITCSISPSSTTLASGGTGSATLTVYTGDVATAGSYNVTVTGKNAAGTVVHTLGVTAVTPVITTTPSFSLSGTPVAISSPGNSGTSTITALPAGGFTGSVAFGCAVTSSPAGATGTPTCSFNPTSANVGAAAGATSTLTVSTSSTTTTGTYTVTVTGTSGSLTASTPVTVTVSATPPSFTLSGTAVTIASQGASGTSTITVTPTNFTGTVTLTCAVTAAPSGAEDDPTCSAASANVTGTGAATATLTINTTAQTAKLDLPLKGIFTAGGGVALGAILFFGAPFGRRRKQQLKAMRALRMLSVAALFALVAGAAIGCGGGSSSSTPPPSGGTTLGNYTLTVTGTSGTTTATTTIVVTVN